MTSHRVNILLVDDDQNSLLALEATLETLGQKIVTATSGEEALRQVLNCDFSVILLDVHMSELNGIETAAAIRQRERSKHVPIIFLTGMGQTDEMMFQGYSTGAVDYLMKPVQPGILRAKVEVFVELGLARQRLQSENIERTRIAAEVSKLNQELAEKNSALEERTRQLQETVSELESYSYSISHDMRAPLRAMKGYAEILIEDSIQQLDEEHQHYLLKISTAAERLDQLIQDVLSYSRLSRSKAKLEPVDLDRLVRDIIEQYPGLQPPLAETEVRGELPKVLGNEAFLTQCISNLLINATKFVAPGVTPRIEVSAEERGENCRIWFVDNGIGISPRDIDRIFGIFVKVHAPETYMGTGIGLSIVRRAVEKMAGQVGVESELGHGSRFWLQLRNARGMSSEDLEKMLANDSPEN